MSCTSAFFKAFTSNEIVSSYDRPTIRPSFSYMPPRQAIAALSTLMQSRKFNAHKVCLKVVTYSITSDVHGANASFLVVSPQLTLVINPVLDCRYFSPDLQLLEKCDIADNTNRTLLRDALIRVYTPSIPIAPPGECR